MSAERHSLFGTGANTGTRQHPQPDWQQVVHTILVSRALDELEETQLLPARKILYQFTARGHDVTLSASVGEALFPDHGTTIDDLIRHADTAMYRDKASRREATLS